MEKLNDLTLKTVREMEKRYDTYKPKEIWVIVWQIMLERHEQKKKLKLDYDELYEEEI